MDRNTLRIAISLTNLPSQACLEALLWVPLPSEARQVAILGKPFSVVMLKLRNSLPIEICLFPFIVVFHQQASLFLLTFLLFCWPSSLDVVLRVLCFIYFLAVVLRYFDVYRLGDPIWTERF